MIIGSHISIAKGFSKAAIDALHINAETFQFFTRNPRGGKAKDLDANDLKILADHVLHKKLQSLVAHAPYTMNLASPDKETLEFSRKILREDILRLSKLPCSLYVFHPGYHLGQGAEAGIQRIASSINLNLSAHDDVFLLLETMSGKGTEIGSTFEELKEIIDRVALKDKVGVCLDTCHLFSAGYDLENGLEDMFDRFDRLIGLKRIKSVHLNNSKHGLSSHKDRHEKLRSGRISGNVFRKLLLFKPLADVPFILETPNDLEGWKSEITWLKTISNRSFQGY